MCTTPLGTVSWNLLAMIFTLKCYKLLKSLLLFGWKIISENPWQDSSWNRTVHAPYTRWQRPSEAWPPFQLFTYITLLTVCISYVSFPFLLTHYIGGDMIEAMARAVENADVILACITQGYQESKNCRTGDKKWHFNVKSGTCKTVV